jgi:hypothetical protein
MTQTKNRPEGEDFAAGKTKNDSDTSLGDAARPVDFATEVHLEKSGLFNELQQYPSEPPYTIWGPGSKIWIILLVSISALISPFGATTFFPALNVLTGVLDITPTQLNLSITTYMVC